MLPLVGIAASDASRQWSHWISFFVTLAFVTGITLYLGFRVKRRRGTFWRRWGPTLLTATGGALVMADLFRHVLQDLNWWPSGQWPGSSEYRSDCDSESMSCLSAVGWIFTVVCTYTGYVLLFVGTMWNADIIGKLRAIRSEWARLRGG